jgi:long-chain fatty acid transport protein
VLDANREESTAMTHLFVRTRIAVAIGGLVTMLGAGQALGAGFALQENSGSGLGNAFAGGAAVAEDASTIWANPAGMSRIGTNQVAAAIYFITPSMKFSNNASQPAAVCPQGVPPCGPDGIYQPLGGNGGDAGSLAVVPNLFLVVPINKQWSFGLGVNGPFGLVTEYDDSWLGRYHAVKSDIKTYNVNPALSWKLADNFTIAAGADYQHIKATLTSNVNYSGAIGQGTLLGVQAGQIPAAAVAPLLTLSNGLDANATVDGSDDAWGWNVGALWEIDRNARLGLSYRSSVKYHVTGNANISTPPAPALPPTLAPIYAAVSAQVNANPQLASGGVYADIELPQIANLSYFRSLNDKWDIMMDVQWTGWSTIQDLAFYRTSGALFSSTPEHWKDVWRYALGANYKYNDQWKFRGGVAFDQSPVPDEYRTPRLPDDDRIWLAAGAQYKMGRQWAFDLGVAYGWANGNVPINDNAGSTASYGLVNGDYKVNFLIVSGQVAFSF